jgi:hypothetical protein
MAHRDESDSRLNVCNRGISGLMRALRKLTAAEIDREDEGNSSDHA